MCYGNKCFALRIKYFHAKVENYVILMCVIPVMCVTNERGQCSQTTHLRKMYSNNKTTCFDQ